ncbi:MAG: SUMF1/EgtB/PvdO family nonheme iron enzyme [Planctomycetes bacterium]|nr:SUMF1/EgtB/PvdO family nonheme iron enzyme [Planctomycetota bacterium]
MARNMTARYPSMLDLAQDVRALLENRVVSAYESGPIAELRKWVKRNKALAAVAMIAVLGIAGFGSWAFVARGAALAERERVLRLSDAKTLDDLKARMESLWPAHPEKIATMEEWLGEARKVADRLAQHEATLAELRARGTPAPHAREPELAAFKTEAADLAQKLQAAAEGDKREALKTALAEQEARIASLEAEIERTRPHEFADEADAWWHETLVALVLDLAAFLADDRYAETVKSVEERLAFARTIEARSIGDERAAWDQAIASIANKDKCPTYGGLTITPQLGLVPIGRDPDSGLWEFWHVQTGERPARNDQGKLVLEEATGIVFVLIPGGTFWMGAQAKDPEGRNYDPQAQSDESGKGGQPVEVTHDAFFLSKYEMTQGQWRRFVGANPSCYHPGNYQRDWSREGRPGDLLHPVEQVSWDDCVEVLGRLGLVLPTEAQWEYACRAGTDTPWWTGRDKLELDEAGNLNDAYAKAHGGGNWVPCEMDLDDARTGSAPAGTYRANGFGLHDTIGNLWEWCRDGYGYYVALRQGDAERQVQGPLGRVCRGGCFAGASGSARSALRFNDMPERRVFTLGCRAARVVED